MCVCVVCLYLSVCLSVYEMCVWLSTIRSPNLDDLCEMKPSLGNSFRSLLEYEGDDFDEQYTLHFEITRNQFGEVVTKELIPGGSQINVTKENR